MSLAEEAPAVRKLFDRYHDVPASQTSVSFGWLRFTIVAWCFRWIPISISIITMDARLFPCRGRESIRGQFDWIIFERCYQLLQFRVVRLVIGVGKLA